MLCFPLKAAAIALSFTALAGGAQAATTYKTLLSGANENPPNASAGTGEATVIVDGNLLTLSTSFSGLTGTVTAAHIHCCAAPPANVGVATQVPTFLGFPTGVTSGVYNQTFDLTLAATYNPAFVTAHTDLAGARAALMAGLGAGQAYLNIHTTAFPAGEIRGNFSVVPEPSAWALMIVGFGGAGALLRRRRALAAA